MLQQCAVLVSASGLRSVNRVYTLALVPWEQRDSVHKLHHPAQMEISVIRRSHWRVHPEHCAYGTMNSADTYMDVSGQETLCPQ